MAFDARTISSLIKHAFLFYEVKQTTGLLQLQADLSMPKNCSYEFMQSAL